MPTDEAFLNATRDGRLEQVPQKFTVAEAPVPVLRERGMVRVTVTQIEAAKPPISQAQMNLLAQPPLRPDTEAIAQQQHPDEEIGIDGRPPGMAVEMGEAAPDTRQIHEPVDGAQQVVLWDMILK